MSASKILVLAALVSACIGVALGFEWIHTDDDPDMAAWICLALGFYFTADLVER